MNKPCSNLSSIESLVFGAEIFYEKSLREYKDYLKEHINFTNYRMNRIIKCDQEIDKLLQRLSNPPQNLIDLINQIRDVNKNQYFILSTLRNEENKILLENYTKNTNNIKKNINIEGIFFVKSETERIYEIKVYKHGMNEKGSFSCNCPDYKFNSKKKNIVCKHICYIVCNVAKIFDLSYFENKQLTLNQFNILTQQNHTP